MDTSEELHDQSASNRIFDITHTSLGGRAIGNYSQSEKTTVDMPLVVDTVSIEISLVAMLELFKFWTCKQRRSHHGKCINEKCLDYFPNVF